MGYGPTFGEGHRIFVNFNGNKNHTRQGFTYEVPPNGKDASVFFTGDTYFTVDEMEVYAVKCNCILGSGNNQNNTNNNNNNNNNNKGKG